jgi:uncharacterized protein GlcG (DUF336 family)
MRTRAPGAAIAAACLALALPAAAQEKPNPLDVVADKMPFDIPYGPAISLARANEVIAAAAAESTKRGWKLVISVVDSGGHLVAMQRQDGAQIGSVDIANHKARASAKFRRETKVFETGMFMGGLTNLATLDDVIASRGGIPLVENGRLIGAIGCSGGTGAQDEVACRAGAALVK